MRLNLPASPELARILRDLAQKIDVLASGAIVGISGRGTAPPSAGNKGDFFANTDTVELGSVGSKYVLDGWRCVASGDPATWVEKRSPTGN